MMNAKIALKVQKAIRAVEDDLVIWIQDALDNASYAKATGESSEAKGKTKESTQKLEESQFRNLVRVANASDSPEVIKNFLRYQVGRDDKWGRGKNSLAQRIVSDIDGNLKKAAEEISTQNNASQKVIWIELIRRYLGYGSRYLKYLNPSK
ncbi:hypothetical protein [Trichothermofontia sp.]